MIVEVKEVESRIVNKENRFSSFKYPNREKDAIDLLHLCEESENGGTGDGEDGDTHLGSGTLESWWGGWDDWDGGVGWDGWNTGSSGDWVGWGGWGLSLNWSLNWDLWGLWLFNLWLLDLWLLDLWLLNLWGWLWGWGNLWSSGLWGWGGDWDVGGGVSWASSLLWWARSDGHDLGLVDDNVWVGNSIDTEDNGGDSGDGRETHFDVCLFFRVEKLKKRFLKVEESCKE